MTGSSHVLLDMTVFDFQHILWQHFPVRRYRIYATGSATANAAANIVIPTAGTIRQLNWAFRFNSITDGAQVDLELSQSSTTEIATNNAQQFVGAVRWESNFVTSGLAQGAVNLIMPVSVSFQQGQLVYLHAVVAGTVTYVGHVDIWM